MAGGLRFTGFAIYCHTSTSPRVVREHEQNGENWLQMMLTIKELMTMIMIVMPMMMIMPMMDY